jgi:two-component system alkaline phosphatase synthesis response regulator PhoP
MSDKYHILLVEDEEHLQEALQLNLQMEGYDVTVAGDGAKALSWVTQAHFDLIIMDVMLPEIDGISVTETIRLTNREVPILMLSARDSSDYRIAGLRKGADDYLTKPFHLEELLLRIGKLIEKNNKQKQVASLPEKFEFGGNVLDFGLRRVTTFRGEKLQLTKKEWLLLRLLLENKGEVVPREKILQMVWGYQVYPNTRTIDNFILNFRKYFEQDSKQPRYFHSVRGVGYRFDDQD